MNNNLEKERKNWWVVYFVYLFQVIFLGVITPNKFPVCMPYIVAMLIIFAIDIKYVSRKIGELNLKIKIQKKS